MSTARLRSRLHLRHGNAVLALERNGAGEWSRLLPGPVKIDLDSGYSARLRSTNVSSLIALRVHHYNPGASLPGDITMGIASTIQMFGLV